SMQPSRPEYSRIVESALRRTLLIQLRHSATGKSRTDGLLLLIFFNGWWLSSSRSFWDFCISMSASAENGCCACLADAARRPPFAGIADFSTDLREPRGTFSDSSGSEPFGRAAAK